jgi:hypothetical protein
MHKMTIELYFHESLTPNDVANYFGETCERIEADIRQVYNSEDGWQKPMDEVVDHCMGKDSSVDPYALLLIVNAFLINERTAAVLLTGIPAPVKQHRINESTASIPAKQHRIILETGTYCRVLLGKTCHFPAVFGITRVPPAFRPFSRSLKPRARSLSPKV